MTFDAHSYSYHCQHCVLLPYTDIQLHRTPVSRVGVDDTVRLLSSRHAATGRNVPVTARTLGESMKRQQRENDGVLQTELECRAPEARQSYSILCRVSATKGEM